AKIPANGGELHAIPIEFQRLLSRCATGPAHEFASRNRTPLSVVPETEIMNLLPDEGIEETIERDPNGHFFPRQFLERQHVDHRIIRQHNGRASAFRSASVVLPNNSMVDVLALEKLTGKEMTVGIAFNRFFNPFVWEKIHYFRLRYDAQGRAVAARELMGGPGGTPGEQSLEFDWDGMQLTAIRGYLG